MKIDVTVIRKFCCAVNWQHADELWQPITTLIMVIAEHDVIVTCDFYQSPVKHVLKVRPGNASTWTPIIYHETT